jgi:acyl-CoA thioester hydrolase
VSPFISHRGTVRPGWVDDNGHMNLAFYLVLFDSGSDALFEILGIGESYRRAAICTCFAAETHLVYEQEVLLGQEVEIFTRVFDADERRMHVVHEMLRDSVRVCMQEIMFVNVNLATRRSAPWTVDAAEQIQAAVAQSRMLPAPAKMGRAIGIRRQQDGPGSRLG